MEFKISREEIKKGLSLAQNVVERKTTKPILSNALLKCHEGGLRICATDLEIGVTIELEAKVAKTGQLAVPAKNLYEMVKEIQADEITFERKDEQWLEVKAGRAKFKIAGLPPQEFPTMPEVPTADFLHFDAVQFRTMITKTLFAASSDEAKYNLNGIFLESIEGKRLRMVATDGHRLCYSEREMAVTLPKPVLLPRKGVLELQKLLENNVETLPLRIEGRNVIATLGPVTLFIRLMEGDFPNYKQILPKNNDRFVKVPKADFTHALRRVSLLSQDHHRGVKMTFSPGHLELLCRNPDLGEAKEEVECEYKDQHLEIGFNYRYFLDVLAVLEDEIVTLALKDEVSPCLIGSAQDTGFVSLVMPMRL